MQRSGLVVAAAVLAGIGMFNRFGPDWQAALGGVGSPTDGLPWVYWVFGTVVSATTGVGLWLTGRWPWAPALGALAALPPVVFALSPDRQDSITNEVSIGVLDSCSLASAVWLGLGVAAAAQHLVRAGKPIIGALVAGFALGGAPAFGSVLEHLVDDGIDLYHPVLFTTAAALVARVERDRDPKALWTIAIGVVAAAAPLLAGWAAGSAHDVGELASGAVLAVSVGLLLGAVVLALPLGWRAMAWVAVIALLLAVLRVRLGRMDFVRMDTAVLGAYALVGLVLGLGVLLPTRRWVTTGVCAALAAFTLLVAGGDPVAKPVIVVAAVLAITAATGTGMIDLAPRRSNPVVLITLAAMASAGAFLLRVWAMVGLPFGLISPLDVPDVFDAVALVLAAALLVLLSRSAADRPAGVEAGEIGA